jgi:hypothetical protein
MCILAPKVYKLCFGGKIVPHPKGERHLDNQGKAIAWIEALISSPPEL